MAETLRQLDDSLSAAVASYAQKSSQTKSEQEVKPGADSSGTFATDVATPLMMLDGDQVDVSTEEEDNISEVRDLLTWLICESCTIFLLLTK